MFRVTKKELTTIFILCFINLINYMDRYTVAGVLEEIQTYYKLNDKEGGLLQTSFIVFYMVTAPFFGYLGDRISRKHILLFGILFWTITTFLGSFISSDLPWLFFVMRALVGIGEASYCTIAPTIIGDLFIKNLRTKVLTIFYLAIPVGSGLGYLTGSYLTTYFHNWKYSLRFTPFFGLFSVVLVYFFLKDPARGQSEGVPVCEKSSLKNDIIYLTKIPSYFLSTLGFTCVCFAIGSMSWFAPKYIIDALTVDSTSNINKDSINLTFGIVTVIGGIGGVTLGAITAQHFRKKTNKADALICSFGVLTASPFIYLSLISPRLSLSFTFLFILISLTLLCVNWALVADMLLGIIVPQRRSFAQSLQILISHLLGDAFSPYIVGMLSDQIRHQSTSLLTKYLSIQYAMYINCFVLILGGVSFFFTSYFIIKDQEICKMKVQAPVSTTQTNKQLKSVSSSIKLETDTRQLIDE